MAIAITGVNYSISNNSKTARTMELVKISKPYADCTIIYNSYIPTFSCETGDGVLYDKTNAAYN